MSQSILVPFVVGAVVLLVVLVAVILVFRDRSAAVRWIESLFRRPPRPPRTPGSDHYYKPYWS
jgi:hypothetical protein